MFLRIFDALFLQNCICWILFGTLTIIFDVLDEIIGKIIENRYIGICPIIDKIIDIGWRLLKIIGDFMTYRQPLAPMLYCNHLGHPLKLRFNKSKLKSQQNTWFAILQAKCEKIGTLILSCNLGSYHMAYCTSGNKRTKWSQAPTPPPLL